MHVTLSELPYLWDLDKQEQKRWETCFKVMNWGGNTSHEMGTLCIGKGGSHYVRLLYCETLL